MLSASDAEGLDQSAFPQSGSALNLATGAPRRLGCGTNHRRYREPLTLPFRLVASAQLQVLSHKTR